MGAFDEYANSLATSASGSLVERCLDTAAGQLVVVRQVLADYGDLPLRDYLRFPLRFTDTSCQDRADLVDVVRQYVTPLLGHAVAERAANDLALTPVVLTANHHGVDFFAQSIQGTLAFALRESTHAVVPSTVPVFACGAVPLNNLTFPRGMLLYRRLDNHTSTLPIKLPVFPDRCKRELVSTVRGMDDKMVNGVERRAQRLFAETGGAADLQGVLQKVLQEDYRDPAVLARASYSEQAVILNHRLWKRLFREPDTAPDLVYLEIEKIAARLLCNDLANEESLAWRVFFESKVRDTVLRSLDGQRACWSLSALRRRLRPKVVEEAKSQVADNCGTVFFWGVDDRNRRIPLGLEVGNERNLALVGIGDRGERVHIPFNPVALCDALASQKLIPALFSSYLAINLARGVTCVGGYYQAEYLPAMQRAVATALQQVGGTGAIAEKVSLVPTAAYLSGMQMVMSPLGHAALTPAGALEIIAGGGISAEDLGRIETVTVREAHLASVADTMLEIAPHEASVGSWQELVGADLKRTLGDRVVMK